MLNFPLSEKTGKGEQGVYVRTRAVMFSYLCQSKRGGGTGCTVGTPAMMHNSLLAEETERGEQGVLLARLL